MSYLEQQNLSLFLAVLFPLVGAAMTFLFTKNRQGLSGVIASSFIILSFCFNISSYLKLRESSQDLYFNILNWISITDTLSINFALSFDNLTSVMCLIVTGVGSLISIYAIGYMSEDDAQHRFFSYICLFIFSMLLLVMGDNLLVVFFGWEGVGVCSYLLIGFWHKNPENAKAGQKAFVVNRIGDAGFLLAIFLIIQNFGSLDFDIIREASIVYGSEGNSLIEIIAILLFIGAVGKSAQIPLFVWLPDAMAGPTPVSALIHAATMVTSGVYLLTRMSFLFVYAPVTLMVVACVGTITAFVAATIAITQNDIKKVLAYSTVSQLGYMFMAVGAGAFTHGLFHVVTHAFFKACLFMGAGSVIMGCHHEQDMRKMGGLRKLMPITFVTYLVATLAISGFPFTSGFFSKDLILWSVFSRDFGVNVFGFELSTVLWFFGYITALMTAFYMTRSLVLTFFGSYRGDHHPHESPTVVTVPLLILAGFSGFFGLFTHSGDSFIKYLGEWTMRKDFLKGHEYLIHLPNYHLLEYLSIGAALVGISFAALLYTGVIPLKIVSAIFKPFYKLSYNKWYFDEIYNVTIVKPLGAVARICFSLFDRILIDGLIGGLATTVGLSGSLLSSAHTGRVGIYLRAMIASILLIVIVGVFI